MEKLIVSLERDGILCPVGSIRGESPSDACFAYAEEYRDRPDAAPISLSLPLQEEAFTPTQTKNFFEGLLPEGFTRRTVAQWMHVAEEDYLSILHGLGRECLGALCITAEREESEASYERITAQQVRQLAAEGATKSAELVTKAHLSLTGASGKAGLYYDAEHGEWYLPRGSAPSTHIVKQSHVRLDAIVTNEQLALQTAARCGIETAKSFDGALRPAFCTGGAADRHASAPAAAAPGGFRAGPGDPGCGEIREGRTAPSARYVRAAAEGVGGSDSRSDEALGPSRVRLADREYGRTREELLSALQPEPEERPPGPGLRPREHQRL